MDIPAVADAPALFREGEAADADRPLLTYYDDATGYYDATGERTGLSAAALGGWAARTAGLLREGCGVLLDAAEHEHPVKWLLAPLAAGASVVLCGNLDHEAVASRAAAEHVNRIL
jgi:hypothetical protein